MKGVMMGRMARAGGLAVVLALLSPVTGAQSTTAEVCETVALLSRSTMHVRQHGVSLENLLAAHAASGKGYGGQEELVRTIAQDAYEAPEAEGEAAKSQVVEDFGEKWRKLCLAHAPQ